MNTRLLTEYEALAHAHLDATFDLLEDVMGRPPTHRELAATWATWLKDIHKDAGQST